MVYSATERPISRIAQLKRLMRELEDDEALRIEGRIPHFEGGGFIFIGAYGGRYQINICDRVWSRKSDAYTVGDRDEWHHFESYESAWKFLSPIIKRPLRACKY